MESSPLFVDIVILDDNDNAPRFTKDRYAQSVSETSSNGSFVEEVQAIDADVGFNAQVEYFLINGTEYFKINKESGMFLVCVFPLIINGLLGHVTHLYTVDKTHTFIALLFYGMVVNTIVALARVWIVVEPAERSSYSSICYECLFLLSPAGRFTPQRPRSNTMLSYLFL